MSENQIVKKDESIFIGRLFNTITSTAMADEVGRYLIKSKLAPKHFADNPAGLMIAMEAGLQLGLNWFQAMHNIVPINGVPSVSGDASKALILDSGLCEDWAETESGTWKDKDYAVTIKSKRINRPGYDITTFSYEDAQLAGLLSKSGPWQTYPKRMVKYRAIGFHARDYFPDVIKGFKTKEEAEDTPLTEDQGYAQEVRNEETTQVLDTKAAITNIGESKKGAAKKTQVKEIIPVKEVEPKQEEILPEPPAEEILPETELPIMEMLEPVDNEEQHEELPVDLGPEPEGTVTGKIEIQNPVEENKPEVKEKPKSKAEPKPEASEDDNLMLREMVKSAIVEEQDKKAFKDIGSPARPFQMAMKVLNAMIPFSNGKFETAQAMLAGLPKTDAWKLLRSDKYPTQTYEDAYGKGQATKLFTHETEEGIANLMVGIQ